MKRLRRQRLPAALPDVGQPQGVNEVGDNPGSCPVWVQDKSPNAGGDSLHAGLAGTTPDTPDNLTGFTPNRWSVCPLTVSAAAGLDLTGGGLYTLNAWMPEDCLRLTGDRNYIPSGEGPAESLLTGVSARRSHTVAYSYDPSTG